MNRICKETFYNFALLKVDKRLDNETHVIKKKRKIY